MATNNTNDIIAKESSIKGVNYFKHFHVESKKPWFAGKNLPREIVVTINRCRSGHYNLPFSLAKLGLVNDPSCACGWENGDIDHVLWQCPLFDQQRIKLINRLRARGFALPLSCNVILFKPIEAICKLVYMYLNECNLTI